MDESTSCWSLTCLRHPCRAWGRGAGARLGQGGRAWGRGAGPGAGTDLSEAALLGVLQSELREAMEMMDICL